MVKNKNFGFWNRMYSLFNIMAKASQYNKTLSHYSVSFSNSKGNNLIYDSETDTIIDGDSEEEEQDEEKKRKNGGKMKKRKKRKMKRKMKRNMRRKKKMKEVILIQLGQMIHLISFLIVVCSSWLYYY